MLDCLRTRALPFWFRWMILAFLLGTATAPATDIATYHNDNLRTGQNLQETILTTANVNSSTFGKLFSVSVDTTIDAQPLIASSVSIGGVNHNVLYAVTEGDTVYAFDADSGASLWQVSALESGETPSDTRSCTQITPEIGITSTPVIDRQSGPHGTIYVVAMSKDSAGNYYQRLHALDLTTGAEEFGGPVTVKARYPGTGDNSMDGYVVFDAKQYAERAGLLLLNHVIYTAWTSHCDIRPYTGWLVGYNENTLAQTSVLNFTPNGSEGAIWQAGDGLAADGSGNIYFLDANGTFDTTLNARGFPNMGDYGNAIVKVSTASHQLTVADYFNMYNTVSESDSDQDLGSGGILLLPPLVDSSGTSQNLAIGAGKDSNIYIVNRSNMGKFNSNNDSAIYQEVDGALSGGDWSMPAYYQGNVYFGPSGNNLLQFAFTKARLSTAAGSRSATSFTYPGSTPSVSANGSKNGIVWAIEHTTTSVLHAYNAENLGTELYNSSQASGGRDHFGSASHFGTPAIINGKVYVGTTTGIAVFGLLSGQ